MELFGFSFNRRKSSEEKPTISFSPEIKDDGAIVVAAGGSYGTYVDLEGTARSEAELVTRYREMSLQPEVENAIDDIINEAIVTEDTYITRIVLDDVKFLSDSIKKKIEEEYQEVLRLLNFNKSAYEIFKRWYVDGRIYYHVIIDEKNPRNGIQELRYIDPRKMRKVREIERERKNGFNVAKTKNEYYIYNEKGFLIGSTAGTAADYTAAQGLRIAPDAVLYATSGLTDQNNQMVLSYLHKAVRPLNQLRVLEDATVIYRISRAPERRIFYIDVGNLPKPKAEQYVRDMMQRHKNRLVYDSNTGEVRDDRKFITMLEDYWFPRREGGKGTEITTLPAGQNLGELTDVNYFQKKLYKSLYVPTSRLDPEQQFNLATEITRDELKFNKFIVRLRNRFSNLFLAALEKQLVLKNVIAKEEWTDISQYIRFEYAKDNYFNEIKNSEVLMKRLTVLDSIGPYVGKYFSNDYVRRRILMQDDDDIKKEDDIIKDEQDNEQYYPPVDEMEMDGNAPTGKPSTTKKPAASTPDTNR